MKQMIVHLYTIHTICNILNDADTTYETTTSAKSKLK